MQNKFLEIKLTKMNCHNNNNCIINTHKHITINFFVILNIKLKLKKENIFYLDAFSWFNTDLSKIGKLRK